MENQGYKSIPQLIQDIQNKADLLEEGKMELEELESLLNESRSLYERLLVLHYKKAEIQVKGEPEPEKKEKKSLFKFGFSAKPEDIDTNQTSLIDAIAEEEEAIQEEEPSVEEIQEEEIQKEKREEVSSINELFSAEEKKDPSLANQFGKNKIEDLAGAIGINQKFLFTNDLFEGESSLYQEAIERLDGFENLEAAIIYLKKLDEQFGWEEKEKVARQLYELVERRYA